MKALVLTILAVSTLSGCTSQEEERKERIREANKEIQQNARDFQVDSYGSGPVLYGGPKRAGEQPGGPTQ